MASIKALSAMGIDVELTTFEKPDPVLIQDAYGESLGNIKCRTLCLDFLGAEPARKYDITINTHGDMLPFFQQNFSKNNAITYCHYPIAEYLIDCGDPDYAAILQNMSLRSMRTADVYDVFYAAAGSAYKKMMANTMVLTNSEFSRRAILKAFGIEATVLYPPVDVDAFRNASLSSDVRDDAILVISRFHPGKKIENAIRLAKLLKRDRIGKSMNIVGNISHDGFGYYSYLRHLVKHYDLEDFVHFELNVRFDRLLALMQRCKVYLHPMPGEPFGISTVEAMSAGMIPVVPDIGGHTEFVPQKYQFHTFGQGVETVALALDAPASERIMISHSTQKYSVANYVKRFQQLVSEILGIAKPIEQTRVISVKKPLSEASSSSPSSKSAKATATL